MPVSKLCGLVDPVPVSIVNNVALVARLAVLRVGSTLVTLPPTTGSTLPTVIVPGVTSSGPIASLRITANPSISVITSPKSETSYTPGSPLRSPTISGLNN